ncbi:MAG: hypothetical protein KC420_12825 [Myxococcales bacterium]|nr:hypothetical protein [Myxococcales bacterium]MCB9568698.1 hypothetical protein [Myxococcales bacterium]MCB9706650.1 hypothetical protein [Myxococcales bacterium]
MVARQRGWRALGAPVGFALLLGLGATSGCKPKEVPLAPPAGTPAMDPTHAAYFDDGLTATPVVLVGRAPADVVDQGLFAHRLGHADLVVVVTIEDMWERSRGKGAQRGVEVELGEVLLGEVPKRTSARQELRVVTQDPLPGELRGQRFILFVRWSPGERPPERHHLMVADDATIEVIEAMVAHATEAGALKKGVKKRTKRGARAGGKGAKGSPKGAK